MTPLHIGSLPGYLAGIQETLQGGEWNDGDLVIHNHPYDGSSHSPDIAVVVPVFHEAFWSAIRPILRIISISARRRRA